MMINPEPTKAELETYEVTNALTLVGAQNVTSDDWGEIRWTSPGLHRACRVRCGINRHAFGGWTSWAAAFDGDEAAANKQVRTRRADAIADAEILAGGIRAQLPAS